jgi:hypothetical protein
MYETIIFQEMSIPRRMDQGVLWQQRGAQANDIAAKTSDDEMNRLKP